MLQLTEPIKQNLNPKDCMPQWKEAYLTAHPGETEPINMVSLFTWLAAEDLANRE